MSTTTNIADAGNVVAFRHPADNAVGRDRQKAARAITRRLQEIAASADFRVQHPAA